MNAEVRYSRLSERVAPATLLGHNLELFAGNARLLLSDRLDNPKFAGPAHPQTGIAREWASASSNFMGIRYELVDGDGILGTTAQLIESATNRRGKGLVQPGRWVRQGETLEVSFWARCLHEPVTVRVGLRPAPVWATDYDSCEAAIESPCWKEYRATLTPPSDDRHAVFFFWVENPGVLFLDQIHLRPAGAGALREDLLATLGSFRIPVLRYPGGCVSTAYHWECGTGPSHLRPIHADPVFKREMNYEFGTDEYLDFCQKHGIIPMLTVNIGTGTPDEAAEWAGYCAGWYRSRDIEPPLIYWVLGNEHYGHWERAHMTGAMYAEVVRTLAPGIRAAYPRARIVALGPKDGESLAGGPQPWRAPLLERAGDMIDLVALLLYSTLPHQSDTRALHTQVLHAAEATARTIQQALDDCQRGGRGIRVAMPEWNLWIHASHFAPEGFVEPMDLQHGIYAATIFHHLARLAPGIEQASIYHLFGGMGLFVVDGPDIRPSLVAEVFRLYRPAFPGRVFDLDASSFPVADNLGAVEALGLQADDAGWLFLANRSLTEAASVNLRNGPEIVEGVTLTGADPLQTAADIQPARASDTRAELPPLSITRLRMKTV